MSDDDHSRLPMSQQYEASENRGSNPSSSPTVSAGDKIPQ